MNQARARRSRALTVTRMTGLLWLGALGVPGGMNAQSVTSPAGFQAPYQGDSWAPFWYGSGRHQQVDNTHAGAPRLIQGLGFRREGSGGGPGAVARSFDLRVQIAEVDMGRLDPSFEVNLGPSTVEVLPWTRVSMPDWTAPNAPNGNPFDFIVPFATPFQYTGVRALLIDFEYVNNTSNDVVFADFEIDRVPESDPVFFGQGCVGSTAPGPLSLLTLWQNGGIGMPNHGTVLTVRVERGVTGAATFLFIDFSDPMIQSPILCTTLHARPTLQMFLGNCNAQGSIDYAWYSFPAPLNLGGATIFTQAMQFDPTPIGQALPITFSNAVRNQLPFAPIVPASEVASRSIETPGPTQNPYSFWQWGRSLIIELR